MIAKRLRAFRRGLNTGHVESENPANLNDSVFTASSNPVKLGHCQQI
jgi:hypothetical protein